MASYNGGLPPIGEGGIQQRNLPDQAWSATFKAPMGSEFFKFLGGGKRLTRDGQPPKRRGPKPDSKPAATRRQELNRQSQRTHRERKEQYMRELENEVSRLREAYAVEISAANVSIQQHQQRVQTLSDENDVLRGILSSHGIPFEAEVERRKAERAAARSQYSPFTSSPSSQTQAASASTGNQSYAITPTTTVSNNVSPSANGTTYFDISPTQQFFHQPPAAQAPQGGSASMLDRSGPAHDGPVQAMPAAGGIFEEDPQLQIDFILTLESPCREHTDFLCRRSIAEADDEDMPFSGHALMATCPPPSYLSNTTSEQTYPHKTYDLPSANLRTLLNLSRTLVTEGQITPIMALQCLKNHELYHTLTRDDVKIVIETLNTKVRCYGFGACVEDFELMDCLSQVLGTKVDVGFSQSRDDMLYS